jgi:ubiquinol-cytochrome c reductase cytochrome b subunit
VANLAVAAALFAAGVGLSAYSVWRDANDPEHQAALAAGRSDADRVHVLIEHADGIPPAGALSLLHNDVKTEGTKLFKQHCAACHNYSQRGILSETPSAPDLSGYPSQRWLEGFLDPKQIAGPKYFGNCALSGKTGDKSKSSTMVTFVKGNLKELRKEIEPEDFRALVTLLPPDGKRSPDDAKKREKLKPLLEEFTCTDCHHYDGQGKLGKAPDLTGWGSRPWLIGIISNPADERFYGAKNDRMPAYAKTPDERAENTLGPRQLEILADWLYGDWYEP